ncbi:agamous-like MADS-box protein AGL62 [Carex littledalei]|uniref:Agamous-like MADS-box protein AGL62 n=1 Tax=Carex littledalei TaxID=544730 RepID=A0A833QAU0_9POAL|nr:agamous-like MADS-box protein AGL62 [Carex littledalei]
MAEQPAQLTLMAINADEREVQVEGEVQASPSPSPLKRKRTSGRRKLPLEKIEKLNARQVCFSKRRKGLFHKAYEISVLCGAHVEVLAFSSAGNPFSCAYPSNSPSLFAKVIGLPSEQSLPELISNSQTALSQQLSELTARLEAGKKKKEALQATLKRIEDIRSADVSKMEPAELEALKKSLEQVRAAMGLSQ